MVGPARRADEVGAFAHLVYPAHACDLDRLFVADADEDGGALEEKCLRAHLEDLNSKFVVVDHEVVLGHRHWLRRHRVLVHSDPIGLEFDVFVPEARSEVEVVLLFLDGLALQVVGLYLVLELLHRLAVVPGLRLHLDLQQFYHLLDGPSQMLQRVPQYLRDILDLVYFFLLLIVNLLQFLKIIDIDVLLALLLLDPLLVLQFCLPQRLLENPAHLRQLSVEHGHD